MAAADDGEHGAGEPDAGGPEGGNADAAPATPAARRGGIDLTGALGVAGHEVELLHAEDVPDTAPVIGPHTSGNDLDLDVAASSALRGMDAGLFDPGDDSR